jgi:dihydropyrimidine dehydrogenase (NAD+) subunit PreA
LCSNCQAGCEKACVHADTPIRIKSLAQTSTGEGANRAADLSIDFCGVRCENPFFLSSSVVVSGHDMCADALNMGWSGIVYKTIGLHPIREASPRFDAMDKDSAQIVGFRNWEQISDKPAEREFSVLSKLKKEFPNKVIAASIMGQNEAEWVKLTKMCNEADVDIIECNFSCPHMSVGGMGSDVGTNPELVGRFTKVVCGAANVPVLAKMTPNITHLELPAQAAVSAGANGIAAINTIKSLTNVMSPSVAGKTVVSGYSGKAIKPLALRFIHDLKKNAALQNVPISGIGGIETWLDAAEFLSLGCSNVQVTTAVMLYGYRIIYDLVDGLAIYLAKKHYKDLSGFVGSALQNIVASDALDRNDRTYPVFDRNLCVNCGRCYISCRDGGHQAIGFAERKPVLESDNCVGCHLCSLVCPVGAINKSNRIAKY